MHLEVYIESRFDEKKFVGQKVMSDEKLMRLPSSKRLNFSDGGSVIVTKAIEKHSTLNAQIIHALGQLKLKMDQNEIITFATMMRLPG